MAKTYNTISTFTSGQILTATQMNGIGTNVNNYRVPPICVLTIGSGLGTSGVSVTSSGVTFGNTTTTGTYTEEVDTDDMHSASSNQTRITINTAGVYIVSAVMNGNGTSEVTANINKNGTALAYDARGAGGSFFATMTMQCVANLAVNDYLELFGQSVTTRTYAVRFSAVWLGQAS